MNAVLGQLQDDSLYSRSRSMFKEFLDINQIYFDAGAISDINDDDS